MAAELQRTDITSTPELLRLAEEVAASGTPRLLTHGDQVVALLAPAHEQASTDGGDGDATSPDDPLWGIIGLGAGMPPADGANDVSTNKHKYVADAVDLDRR